ncbi:MAG: acyltransferase [Nitrospira sp.]|nr:acyltransferase [Nitrospira sp.]
MTTPHAHLSHPKYRPDIDGLRAIAVLSVITFHAFPGWMKGGFTGVDVFFVISGFLISTIIFQNLVRDTFSFREFYARRIRRIFPALILILIASYSLGWFLLFADEYEQLSKHLAAGAGFISNFVLWGEAGYFDNAAETKPLLHLWSLGIEEQFYIIWPALVWCAWKWKFNLLKITLAIAAISFCLTIGEVRQDATVAFYFPQTRFWELLCGSALAWVMLQTKELSCLYQGKFVDWISPTTLQNMISLVGLVLLTYGVFRIDKDFIFPSEWTLVPVLGAVLIIMAGPESWVNRHFLSHKIAVWFGLVSFPLYLWHWPLLSFARIVDGQTPHRSVRIAALLLSVVLAWLTYEFIERPLRFGNHGKRKVAILLVCMFAIGVGGFETYRYDGLSFRAAHQNFDSFSAMRWEHFKSDGCEQRVASSPSFCFEVGDRQNQKIAVIGDSTGNALAPGLARLYAQHGLGLINIGSHTCPPIRGLVETASWGKRDDCLIAVENYYQLILQSKTIDTVVLALFARDLQSWGVPDVSSDAALIQKFDGVASRLDRDIQALREKGKRVIVSYDVPNNPFHARDCVVRPLRSILKNRVCEWREDLLPDRQPYLNLFDQFFSSRRDVCIVRQSVLLIQNGKSRVADESGKLLIRDSHHLSHYGSDLMAQEFIKSGCLDLHLAASQESDNKEDHKPDGSI